VGQRGSGSIALARGYLEDILNFLKIFQFLKIF
jgi:hypothetical protein